MTKDVLSSNNFKKYVNYTPVTARSRVRIFVINVGDVIPIMICKFWNSGLFEDYINSIQTNLRLTFFSTTKSSYELPEIFFSALKVRIFFSKYKHLGLHLTSDLKWSEHISIIVKKALKNIWSLLKSRI